MCNGMADTVSLRVYRGYVGSGTIGGNTLTEIYGRLVRGDGGSGVISGHHHSSEILPKYSFAIGPEIAPPLERANCSLVLVCVEKTFNSD